MGTWFAALRGGYWVLPRHHPCVICLVELVCDKSTLVANLAGFKDNFVGTVYLLIVKYGI